VIIKASQIVASGSRTISAKGLTPVYSYQDGGGGGGGGGSIILEVPAYSGTLLLDARGGNGGSTINHNNSNCHGGGGGGGGGRVVLSVGSAPAGVTVNVSSGAGGKQLAVISSALCASTSPTCSAVTDYGTAAGATGNTTFNTTINTTVCPTSTPIRLVNLYASLTNDGNVGIYWVTGSELNASHFVVERSSDGQNFEEIGKVKAEGNSQQALSYNFTDENVATSTGHVYYRLRMVDLDGAFEYSKTVGLKLKGTLVSVFPNPVKGEGVVNVVYQSEMDGSLNVSIVDILGRHLDSRQIKLGKGTNQFNLSTQGLPAGIYLIYMNDQFGKTVEKLIVE
jgi:hypothetical protein